MQIDHKWDRLRSLLRETDGAVLAYSGGVDSSLLLRAASEVLGPGLVAVTAISPTFPQGELAAAQSFAASLGVRLLVLTSAELDQEAFVRNAPDRCYHCKRELFRSLREIARTEGIGAVIDGTNVDDRRDYRPGMKAAAEYGVRSPLTEAGLTKREVRELARLLQLPMWDKPSLACLSSRVPYGTRITRELLSNIQAAEDAVRACGIRQVRVRHHGDTARIEVAPADFPRLTETDAASRIVRSLKERGYTYVCLDLEGYRTGSMNAAVADFVAQTAPVDPQGAKA